MAFSSTNYAKKKTTRYRERNEEERASFQDHLKTLDPDKVVFVDEAGVDNRLYREYARASRGQKVFADVCGKERKRVSIIGALRKKDFIAPFTFTGGCNQDVFNVWLEHVLLPELPPETTIIMDNAAFHKSPKTRFLIENARCHLLFLPTYSPDLNPIENCWHKVKETLRPLIQNGYENFQNLIGETVLNI